MILSLESLFIPLDGQHALKPFCLQLARAQDGAHPLPLLLLRVTLSSFSLYRITLGESAYIAKLFPSAKLVHYQREKQTLEMLDHPAITRPFEASHPLSSRLALSLKGELLLFPELSGGDLLEYLRWNGGVSETAARFFTGQVVEALAYAHSKGVLHPNLLAENVLLTAERKAVLAGWSNSTESPEPTL